MIVHNGKDSPAACEKVPLCTMISQNRGNAWALCAQNTRSGLRVNLMTSKRPCISVKVAPKWRKSSEMHDWVLLCGVCLAFGAKKSARAAGLPCSWRHVRGRCLKGLRNPILLAKRSAASLLCWTTVLAPPQHETSPCRGRCRGRKGGVPDESGVVSRLREPSIT